MATIDQLFIITAIIFAEYIIQYRMDASQGLKALLHFPLVFAITMSFTALGVSLETQAPLTYIMYAVVIMYNLGTWVIEG